MREATISRTPRCRGSSSPTRSSAGRKTVLCDLCSVYSFSLTAAASDWLSEAAAAACPPIRSGLTEHEAGRRTEARSCCLEAATWLSLCLALAIWIALERDLNSADIKIFVNVKKIFQPLCWEEELRQQKRDSFRPGCVRQVRNISETIYSSKSPSSPPLSSSSAIFCS